MRIGILGHYGNQNLGDEAIIEAAIDSVRRYFPQSEISCFSINPDDTQERHGVTSYPIRYIEKRDTVEIQKIDNNEIQSVQEPKPQDSATVNRGIVTKLKDFDLVRLFYNLLGTLINGISNLRYEAPFLVRNYKLLRSYDLLLITGSNQFLDNFGGVWGFPYTLLKWITIAKLARTKVALLSLGAGPLESPVSKVFARLSARMADFVSYRDHASQELVEGIRHSYDSFVYPDMASNLKIENNEYHSPTADKIVVGINPMPVYDSRYWCDPDECKYHSYVEKLTEVTKRLILSNYSVFLFNTQRQDNNVIDDIFKQLDSDTKKRVARKTANTTKELLSIIQSAHICVATRFHGTVLSLLSGVPVVGICYHRKIGDLLTNMEQGEYQVNLDSFSPDELYEIIKKLEQALDYERDTIRKGSNRQRDLTESQYGRLAELFLS